MTEFFDTSVMVAAFWGDHPLHEASAGLFAGAQRRRSSCAAHSLAELYSTLTSLPLRPAIAPEQARLFLQDVRERLAAVTLSEAEYHAILDQAARQRVSGGRVYDLLLLRCAAKAKAERIYTWNIKHFQRLSPSLAARIRTP
ncbi:MAG: PIN domain-containing protein [Elusimicrobia bacterium]|nr:PIN domain-containing protein [Elusimicrobiota bacterium]